MAAFSRDRPAPEQRVSTRWQSNVGVVNLPEPSELSVDLFEMLESRRSSRKFANGSISGQTLSTILYGVGERERSDLARRRYPSPGALYAGYLYPVVLNGQDIDERVFRYRHRDHALLAGPQVADRPYALSEVYATRGVDVDAAMVAFVLTGDFEAIYEKYGPRGYRYLLQESGHAVQNLQLVMTAKGIASVPVGGFYDSRLASFLGIETPNEAPIYTIVAGAEP